jgi:hypothetical protein
LGIQKDFLEMWREVDQPAHPLEVVGVAENIIDLGDFQGIHALVVPDCARSCPALQGNSFFFNDF